MSAAPELRDVPGPTALGGGWRRTWDLLRLLAVADFRRIYLGTALGYLWTIGRPLLLFGVLLAVFTQAFRLSADVPNYPVLLLMNLVLFGLFSEATGSAVGAIVAQEPIVRKTQFPRLVIPLAVVLTALMNLALNLVVVVVFLLASGVEPRWTWLLVPVLLLVLVVFTTAVSTLLAALYPRFRDLGILWSVLSTALLYATPVLYPLGVVSETAQRLLSCNPLAPVFALAHRWVVNADAPTPTALAGGTAQLLIPIGLYVGTCVLAVWVFRREAPRVAEAL